MKTLEELADELLPDELKSDKLKVTTKGHINTILKTEPYVTNAKQYYGRFGQPAEFQDEANLHRRNTFID